MKILKKEHIEGLNVFDAALERLRYAFDRFDHVSVSFSGGKDSTAVLNMALIVAEEKGKLPLDVFTYDEEAIHPPTVEYIERVSNDPRINFRWYCLPIKHRNACSRKQPYWYCWNPKEKDKWIRPLPEKAITYLEGFEIGMDIGNSFHLMYQDKVGSKIQLLGIRTEESLRRYRAVTKRVEDNWLTLRGGGKNYRGFPIYDWNSNDVWIAVQKYGWDYNHTYDVMMRYGQTAKQQRVCPPYGEEPLRGIQMYAECFPEMWLKMLNRVHGVASAWRYSNTELYSVNMKNPPDGMTWKDFLYIMLDLYPDKDRQFITNKINSLVKQHYSKSDLPIHDHKTNLVTGLSWKFMVKMVTRGDYKDRIANSVTTEATKAIEKRGMSHEKAVELYGNENFKKLYHEGNAAIGSDNVDTEEPIETQ